MFIDVVETITFETETWLKRRYWDRDFLKNPESRDLKFETETETRDFKISPFCQKNVVITSKLNFFQISDIFPTCFGCFQGRS